MMETRAIGKPMEKRGIAPCELRATGDGKIVGYAAVFETWADNGWGGKEKVNRGAFKKTLKEKPDIRALWNHNTDIVLGRTTNGTLRLWEDDHGLAIELTPPDSQEGRDKTASIARGDVSQMSFGFRVIKDSWDQKKQQRELAEVELFEVSPVTFPFYPTTEVGVREALERAGAEPALVTRALDILKKGKNAEAEEQADHSEQETEPDGETKADSVSDTSEPTTDGDHSEEEVEPSDETNSQTSIVDEPKEEEQTDDLHSEPTEEAKSEEPAETPEKEEVNVVIGARDSVARRLRRLNRDLEKLI